MPDKPMTDDDDEGPCIHLLPLPFDVPPLPAETQAALSEMFRISPDSEPADLGNGIDPKGVIGTRIGLRKKRE